MTSKFLLKMVFSTNDGSQKTYSVTSHVKSNLSLADVQATAEVMISSGVFTVSGTQLVALINAYFEQTTVTEIL